MYSKTKFFLGADSYNGFDSYFRQLQEQNGSMQLLILKGGPGSGKSSLMKKIAAFAESRGHNVEIIPCASDPTSFDAVIDYTQNFSVMDGTAPHTEDPSLPGVLHHILYTGDLWDDKKLYLNRKPIRELNEQISDCHKSASAYIGGANSLLSENLRYGRKFLKKSSLKALSGVLTKKINEGGSGKEKKRFLSAVSVGQIKLFSDTPFALSDDVYIIEDKWGAAADFIITALRDFAYLGGSDFISCPCPVIHGKYDHIIFPGSSASVLTGNTFLEFPQGKKINGEDLYESLPLSGEMEERLFTSEELLKKASSMVEKAKNLHDELELYYREAMDFTPMDKIFTDIISRFYAV